jgi:hypothetical protein
VEGQCVSCEVRRGACMLFQIRFRLQRLNFYSGVMYVYIYILHLYSAPASNDFYCTSKIRTVIGCRRLKLCPSLCKF